jgi:hypothetical protein
VEDEQRQRGTLQGQQLLLAFHPAGVALHRAVRADDPVAGADDSQRVRADRGTDSLDPAARDAELSGQRTVGRGRAVRDGVQGTPDQLLEIGSGRGELEVKDASLTSSLA